jgi:hypothetical protein
MFANVRRCLPWRTQINAFIVSGSSVATGLRSKALMCPGTPVSGHSKRRRKLPEDGHGGRDGRGSDDVVTVVTPVNAVDNDVNDDHGVDAVVTTTAGAPAVVEDRNDAPDDND